MSEKRVKSEHETAHLYYVIFRNEMGHLTQVSGSEYHSVAMETAKKLCRDEGSKRISFSVMPTYVYIPLSEHVEPKE